MRNAIVIVLGAVVLGAVTYAWAKPSFLPMGEPMVACTMEAKLCPDGSYVGRSGPNCEFAACTDASASSTSSGTAELHMHLGETKTDLFVSITPTSVLEDSRCPLDVQCIQAGTVRLQATILSGLGSTTQIFTLNQPITTEAEVITLVGVSPAKYSTHTIGQGEYEFTFEVRKR